MKSHLAIKTDSGYLALGEDFSLDLEYQNPMFNDADSFSYPAELPLAGNRFLLKNLEDEHSQDRPVDLENTKARIYADGLPIFDGKLKTSDDEELTDAVSMNVEGGQTLDELISDLECRDIPIPDEDLEDLVIGEKIGEVEVGVKGNYTVRYGDNVGTDCNSYIEFSNLGELSGSVVFTPQALGFSQPFHAKLHPLAGDDMSASAVMSDSETIEQVVSQDEKGDTVADYVKQTPVVEDSYINITSPYPTKKYCNSRVCYKHYKTKTSDDSVTLSDGSTLKPNVTDSDNTETNPYFVLDANRPASGICFYVQYFLDCLFDYLGVQWDNSALSQIEDFNRLCFFNTKCGYNEEKVIEKEYQDFYSLNSWLSSRGCGAQLSLQEGDYTEISKVYIPAITEYYDTDHTVLDHNPILLDDCWDSNHGGLVSGEYYSDVRVLFYSIGGYVETVDYWPKSFQLSAKISNSSVTSVKVKFCKMYANEQNWPDATVSTIISSLENQFGIRFVYNAEEKKVTARLLRDMYRDQSAPQKFLGTIHEMHKISEKITGVRVGYSAESDSTDQKKNLRDSVRDYDTNYDYIDYPDPNATIGSKGTSKACTTVIDKTYKDICNNAQNNDNTCYVDQQTGETFRIKIDSEATKASEMHPAWFEVGQFKSAEEGDCSAINEDYIVEMMSDFEPLILSDTNADAVRNACANGSALMNLAQNQPLLAPFMDEDMEHEYVQQGLDYPATMSFTNGDVNNNVTLNIHATLNLMENYDTSSSDDGNSPLQNYDWGLAIGIMRGSGASTISKDGKTYVGKYALTADSVDALCNEYDYTGEKFSLKPRAYKQPSWATSPLCKADELLSDGWHYYRGRGYFDRFLYEHAYFLLHRRKFIIRCEVTAAFLQNIRNHWRERYRINGEIGYINKVSTSITASEGIGETEIEFYAI